MREEAAVLREEAASRLLKEALHAAREMVSRPRVAARRPRRRLRFAASKNRRTPSTPRVARRTNLYYRAPPPSPKTIPARERSPGGRNARTRKRTD